MGKYRKSLWGILCLMLCGCGFENERVISDTSMDLTNEKDAQKILALSKADYNTVSELDSTTLALLNKQQSLTQRFKWDSAAKITLALVEYAGPRGDTLVCAKSLTLLHEFQDKSFNNKIRPYMEGAIRSCLRVGWKKDAIILQTRLAAMQSNLGSYDSANALLFKCLEQAEAMQEKALLAPIYSGLANNFDYGNDTLKTELYFSKALTLARELNDSVLLTRANHDWALFRYNYKRDSSLFFYQQALQYLNPGTPPLLRIRLHYNMALLHFDQKAYDQANAFFTSMLNECVKKGYREGEAVAYKAFGFLNRETGKLPSAVSALEKSIQIADSIHDNYLKLQALYELQWSHEVAKHFKEALQTSNTIRELTNIILKEEKTAEIQALEIAYQSKERSLENNLLKKEIRSGNILLAGSLLLSGLLVGFLLLLRQRNRILHERNLSQNKIMEGYRESLMQQKAPPVNQQNRRETDNAENSNIWEKIHQYMDTHTPYLNPKIRAEDFAEAIQIPYRKFAALINQTEGQNFSSLVNGYRVKKARQLLEDDSLQHIKTETLGEMAGFGTRQSFTAIFEKTVGVTPSLYREQIRKEDPAAS